MIGTDCTDVSWRRGYLTALDRASDVVGSAPDGQRALDLLDYLRYCDDLAGPRVHRLRGRLVVVAR